MQTISCNHCGHSVAEDDFISQQCPICDSYMEVSRLNLKVTPGLADVIRVEKVHHSALVDCDLKG